MPQVRKLAEDEVRAMERKQLGQRKVTEVEYGRLLAEFGPGDYGDMQLTEDEKRLTVRNRLKAAAARHEPPLTLVFRHGRGDTLRFTVADASATTVTSSASPLPPAPPAPPATAEPEPAETLKRRGRPPGKKSTIVPADTTQAKASRRGRKTTS